MATDGACPFYLITAPPVPLRSLRFARFLSTGGDNSSAPRLNPVAPIQPRADLGFWSNAASVDSADGLRRAAGSRRHARCQRCGRRWRTPRKCSSNIWKYVRLERQRQEDDAPASRELLAVKKAKKTALMVSRAPDPSHLFAPSARGR